MKGLLGRLLGLEDPPRDDEDKEPSEARTLDFLRSQREAATREANRLRLIRYRIEREPIPFTGERRAE